MVVGSVGSGKSSVISAILGELPTTAGSLAVNGSIAYVAQEAFIFNSTVRENILFGREYDPVKYRQVLEASALMADLSQFTAGDRTEIGERGVNLSGGQKQRISIARALYSNNDIVLLDDPLSAVDSHVGKHIFHKAIKSYLADKLVILTANQVQYLPFANKILFLDNEQVHAGTFEELMATNTTFNDQMTKFGVTQKGEEASEEEEPQKPPVSAVSQPQSNNIAHVTPEDDVLENSESVLESKRKNRKMRHKKSRTVAPAKLQEREKGALIVSEEKKSGLVGFGVYWFYFKKGGLGVFFVLVLLLALSVGSRIVGLWWLSVWTSNGTSAQIYTTTAVCKCLPNILFVALTVPRYWCLRCIHRHRRAQCHLRIVRGCRAVDACLKSVALGTPRKDHSRSDFVLRRHSARSHCQQICKGVESRGQSLALAALSVSHGYFHRTKCLRFHGLRVTLLCDRNCSGHCWLLLLPVVLQKDVRGDSAHGGLVTCPVVLTARRDFARCCYDPRLSQRRYFPQCKLLQH
jgi:ABC-type Mn2+/Zn2+ transport system ATPase subunit